MNALDRRATSLFVDRVSGRWVVRDAEGRFWVLPTSDDPWNEREPLAVTGETDLEPVPGHYKNTLRIPF